MQRPAVSSTYWISDFKPLGFTTIRGQRLLLSCCVLSPEACRTGARADLHAHGLQSQHRAC